ncbi:hypothetical protein INR79_27480 [Vibrio sp. SCSIO 43132]|uniref:hypothetical protein n=1 Tax=Vibrio sp. SCSIO 43132 TaxID=2779363 RepID=UPI001CA92345|nr:hypothetical protein [Vibrio sp. SCSIO 43132]UAB72981.1 hypothetical protein INR79_27480 [Vibrio sp. SCSIO 43132]
MSKKVISEFLQKLIEQLETLTDSDLKKLETGEYTLSLKVAKVSKTNSVKCEKKDTNYSEVEEKLSACVSRELGLEILNNYFANKRELEMFAKYVNVYVMKQDKVDKVKEKIIEGTVGATLRSSAIQESDTQQTVKD